MSLSRKNRVRRYAAPGILAASVVALLTLTACSSPATEPVTSASSASSDGIITDNGFEGLDAKQIIQKLDMMPISDRPTDLFASIRPEELLLTDDQDRASAVPMPDDEFYISFAPYINQTHDCYFHSLTTCRGEIQNEEIDVVVVNDETDEVLLDEKLQTFDNGFAGIWLPRGIEATLTINYQGRTVSSPITTVGDEDPTCRTDLQLM